MLEAEVDSHFLDADVGMSQAALGVFDAEPVPKLVGRGLEIFAEKPYQMVRADVNHRSQCFQCERLGEVARVEQIHRHADALIDLEMTGMPNPAPVEDFRE